MHARFPCSARCASANQTGPHFVVSKSRPGLRELSVHEWESMLEYRYITVESLYCFIVGHAFNKFL